MTRYEIVHMQTAGAVLICTVQCTLRMPICGIYTGEHPIYMYIYMSILHMCSCYVYSRCGTVTY